MMEERGEGCPETTKFPFIFVIGRTSGEVFSISVHTDTECKKDLDDILTELFGELWK